MLFFQQAKHICVNAFFDLQFLSKNKFLKTEFVTHFQRSFPLIKQEKLFYMQDCVKKMLVTAIIYYIDISRKKYLFYNYKYV